ncbi:MAG: hypothetical protein R6U22_00405 [Desulfohalobiaceae bacterium]
MSKAMQNQDPKKAIYDRLSLRRKKFIDRIGYENWDPFQEPNHPIDIRKDITKRTARQLVHEFMQATEGDKQSSAYGRGVHEFCMGMMASDDRYQAMFDFCMWYLEQLQAQGIDPKQVWMR